MIFLAPCVLGNGSWWDAWFVHVSCEIHVCLQLGVQSHPVAWLHLCAAAFPHLAGLSIVCYISAVGSINAGGAGAVLAYSFVLSYVIAKLVDLTVGFRISVDQELAGIDLAIHAERGYEFSDNNQGNFLASSKGA